MAALVAESDHNPTSNVLTSPIGRDQRWCGIIQNLGGEVPNIFSSFFQCCEWASSSVDIGIRLESLR